jgi:biotin carboxylase
MPRILLVAATTGYQTRSFAAAARRLGVEVSLATDRCHILEDPWRDSAIPVRFEDPEAAAQILAQTSVDGVIAVADRPTLVASLTAKKMKIPWHPPLAVAFCRDKHKMRELFALANLPTPENFLTSLNQNPRQLAANAPFPCVLKPLGLSASRGVIRANSVDEFVSAFKRIRRILEQPEIRHLHDEANDAIQIERYIEGREFALEGLMTHGELQVLALFDKPDPLEGPFFEETIYVTPSREPGQIQTEIVNTARRAVRALGLHHGSVHAEMRVNSTGVYMLEVAARPIGGLCARALRFNNGLTLEEVVILHAIGQMPDGLTLSPPALGVMMIPVPAAGIYESVAGIDDALATDGIDDVVITAKQGQKLQPLPEGASYPGFIFASGDNPFIVESALRKAHAHLRFQVLPSLDVIPY